MAIKLIVKKKPDPVEEEPIDLLRNERVFSSNEIICRTNILKELSKIDNERQRNNIAEKYETFEREIIRHFPKDIFETVYNEFKISNTELLCKEFGPVTLEADIEEDEFFIMLYNNMVEVTFAAQTLAEQDKKANLDFSAVSYKGRKNELLEMVSTVTSMFPECPVVSMVKNLPRKAM